MALHDAGAVKRGACAGAARDGFVVLVFVIAEREIGHRAVRASEHAERAVEAIGRGLRHFDIARDDGSGIDRRQHAAIGDDDFDRFQATRVHRNIVVDKRAENVQHHRAAHAAGRVEIAWALSRSTREIYLCRSCFAVDRNLDVNVTAVVKIDAEFAVSELVNHTTDAFFGVVLHMLHVGDDYLAPEMFNHFGQFVRALIAARNLRTQITNILRDIADRVGVMRENLREFVF